MKLTCPHCTGQIVLTVEGAAPRRSSEPTMLTAGVLSAVLDFMRDIEPGRYTAAQLHESYVEFADADGRPAISKNALSRALSRNGAERWRSADERGHIIAEVDPDQRPARPTPGVQKKVEEEAYKEALVEHSTDRVVEAPQHGTSRRAGYTEALEYHSIDRYIDGTPAPPPVDPLGLNKPVFE